MPTERGRAKPSRRRVKAEKDAEARAARYAGMSPEARANALIAATGPLLELFAVVNDVFTEDDALKAAKRRISLGRIYEQWKRTTAALDPGFRDPNLGTSTKSLLKKAKAADRRVPTPGDGGPPWDVD